jgi:hypothetical protein
MKTTRKNSKQRSQTFKKKAKRLAAYSAAAVATLASAQSTANGAEVIHDITDITVDKSTDGVSFHMEGGSTTLDRYGFYYFSEGNFRLTGEFSPDGWLYGPAYTNTDPNGPAPVRVLGFVGGDPNSVPSSYIVPQAATTPVSVADSFNITGPYFSNYYGRVDWSNGQTAFAGIRFALNGGADTHYGWAQITKYLGATGTEFILHGFGYNDTPNAASQPVDTAAELTLEVNETTGEMMLLGDPDEPIAITSYQILSTGTGGNANGLTPSSWNSLADQTPTGDVNTDGAVDGADFLEWQNTGIQDPAVLAAWEFFYGSGPGIGEGWDESGGASTGALGEIYLLGDSTIPAGGSISLGEGYNEQKDTQLLTFEYRTADGFVTEGTVVYTAPLSASAAVPEPSSVLLLAAGAAGLGMWRKRRID